MGRPGINVYFPAKQIRISLQSKSEVPSSFNNFPPVWHTSHMYLFFQSKSQNFPARSFLICLVFPSLNVGDKYKMQYDLIWNQHIFLTIHFPQFMFLIKKYINGAKTLLQTWKPHYDKLFWKVHHSFFLLARFSTKITLPYHNFATSSNFILGDQKFTLPFCYKKCFYLHKPTRYNHWMLSKHGSNWDKQIWIKCEHFHGPKHPMTYHQARYRVIKSFKTMWLIPFDLVTDDLFITSPCIFHIWHKHHNNWAVQHNWYNLTWQINCACLFLFFYRLGITITNTFHMDYTSVMKSSQSWIFGRFCDQQPIFTCTKYPLEAMHCGKITVSSLDYIIIYPLQSVSVESMNIDSKKNQSSTFTRRRKQILKTKKLQAIK